MEWHVIVYIIKKRLYGKENETTNEIETEETASQPEENEDNTVNDENETIETNETNTENVDSNNTSTSNEIKDEINNDYVGVEETEQTTEKTDEEKVIELVKKEYGTEQGVTFNIMNVTDNIYNVSVNDANTTGVLAWYSVDLSTNTITRE